MMEPQQLQSDLQFVRGSLERSDVRHSPSTIYLLWAAIVLLGFPLPDFAPRYVPAYWAVMGPAGTILSAYLGWRHAQRSGQLRRREGFLYLAHWGGLLVVIALASLMIARDLVDVRGFHQFILLILAWTYFLGGVHLERPMLWVGLLIAAGYVVALFITTYVWTILGVVFAAALALTAFVGGSKRAELAG